MNKSASPAPSVPVLQSNTRDGHREFQAACESRARMVRTHKNLEPGTKLRMSDSAYQVQENGSRVKIAELSPAEKRKQKKARWAAARNPKAHEASFNGVPIGTVTRMETQPKATQ